MAKTLLHSGDPVAQTDRLHKKGLVSSSKQASCEHVERQPAGRHATSPLPRTKARPAEASMDEKIKRTTVPCLVSCRVVSVSSHLLVRNAEKMVAPIHHQSAKR
jgi:hypothetical protein